MCPPSIRSRRHQRKQQRQCRHRNHVTVGRPLGADHPHDRVIRAIGRRNERRAATVTAHTPSGHDGRRIGCGNAESRQHGAAGTQSDVGTLVCPISCRRLGDTKVGKVRERHWLADATEVTTIKQIPIAIFATWQLPERMVLHRARPPVTDRSSQGPCRYYRESAN